MVSKNLFSSTGFFNIDDNMESLSSIKSAY